MLQVLPERQQGPKRRLGCAPRYGLNPGGQGGAPVVQISMILMTVAGIVLLIACANIANLLLARANKRRKEIAIRLALGAARVRLVRQLLTESLLLAIVGAGLGLLLAYWLMDALVAADLQLPVPVDDAVTIDGRVLLFTGLLAVVTGLLFGLAPAIQASRADVVPILKNESVPTGTGRGLLRFVSLRQVLVAGQIALSLVSLIAAGLFLRSLRDAQATDTGFETRGVLVMDVNLGREGYTPERGQLFYRQVVERVTALPGVQHASIAQNPPLGGAAADAASLASAVRRQIQEIDPTLSVFDIRTLEDQVSQALEPLRINVVVLTTFGGLALLLASMGLYGVASYIPARRATHIDPLVALRTE